MEGLLSCFSMLGGLSHLFSTVESLFLGLCVHNDTESGDHVESLTLSGVSPINKKIIMSKDLFKRLNFPYKFYWQSAAL